MRGATVLCIMRDERHGRLHFRFRVVDSNMVVSAGHLGQSVGHQSDAVGILDATKKVFRAFCTRRAHAPATATNVTEVFDEELYLHMQKIFLAISVDSASNENESYLHWITGICLEGMMTQWGEMDGGDHKGRAER